MSMYELARAAEKYVVQKEEENKIRRQELLLEIYKIAEYPYNARAMVKLADQLDIDA